MIVLDGVFNFTEDYYNYNFCVCLCLKWCAARLKFQNCILGPRTMILRLLVYTT
jgi:hypothetical protein